MTEFMQTWMRSEHARHQALLHQLKRELAAVRFPRSTSIEPEKTTVARSASHSSRSAAPAPTSMPAAQSNLPRPVKRGANGLSNPLPEVAIR